MKQLILFLILLSGIYGEILPAWTKALEKLTPEERAIISQKATQKPYEGEYLYNKDEGIYRCKLCNSPLYRSKDKFESHCGWPSFDDAFPGAVKEVPDSDGMRTEIVCAKCGAHLGHVFRGERYTAKDTRHCVNSLSLKFEKKPEPALTDNRKAYFGGGCFWGVEYYMEKQRGVISVRSGFMGGKVEKPSYDEVTRGDTGHYEVVEVTYNPKLVSYEELAKLFFEIHDPTQKDGQGPDIAERYRSVVFVNDEDERETIEKLIGILRTKGYDVATMIREKKPFYKAEEYHQDYYETKGQQPYCHTRIKRF